MSNPCIGPNGIRYAFVVKKSNDLWVSRRLFVLSKIDDVHLMGQYLRDMWYMETLCPDDIREFMIIPINKHTIFSEIATTLKSCSNHASYSDLLNIVREKYNVQRIYNFELSKHAIQKYIEELCDKYENLNEFYGIASNKGYGTAKHMEGIKQHGISKWHRKTFGICRQYD